MTTISKLYEKWCAQPDHGARDRLLSQVLVGDGNSAGEPLAYCSNLEDANKAVNQAWGGVEEETAPRYTCLVDETAEEGRKKCVVEWWPDDNTHIATPRFETEAEAKAFAAYVFASLEAE
jgi:hypothetical protein